MTLAEVVQIIHTVEGVMQVAVRAGIHVEQLLADIREAQAIGRPLTDEQIDGYARRAADAVERL